MNQFKAISLSYKNTPLKIREIISLDPESSATLINQIKDWEEISDILVLSTCNRTEVYYTSPIDYSYNIIQAIFRLKGIDTHAHYQDYFQHINHHSETVEHLFRVAMGLDSQVVGDMQITNQVKQAYQLSADLNVAGPFLHRLLHTIFFTNKRVVQETPFRSGAASTSYATVELLEEFAQDIHQPKVLVIGIGEIGADVCRHLGNSFIEDVQITNRTPEKAQALAEECQLQVLPFDQVDEAMQEADIIICSVAKSTPFIDRERIASLDILSFKYFIDLAVPRGIHPDVEEIPGVVLYNIDQIHNRASDALNKRLASIPDVEAIIQDSIADFHEWSKEMEISPVIQKLKNALEQIRQEELARYTKKLSTEEAAKLDQMTKNMMQKVIKLPALHLKAACKRGEAETLIDVLNDLFNLENQPAKAKG